MSSSKILVLVLAVLATSGCKKKSADPTPSKGDVAISDYEKKTIASLEDRLKFVEGLKGKLAPPTTSDGVTLDAKDWSPVWWVHDTDLANVEATPTGSRLKDAGDIRACAKEARHPDFGKHSLDRLGTCDRTRYALVVRTLARVEPKVTQQANGPQAGKFIPGSANGDVVVYDMRAKKPIGGYRWAAQNDSSVVGGTLMKDFEENILEAIEAGGRKFLKH